MFWKQKVMFKKFFLILGILVSLLMILEKSALAQNSVFLPILENPKPNYSSDVNLEFIFNQADKIPVKIEVAIPPGFELAASTSFPDSTTIGKGFVTGWISGQYLVGSLALYTLGNSSDPAGINWRMEIIFPQIASEYNLEINVAGNNKEGYRFFLSDLSILGLTAPVEWNFKILGKTLENALPIITNPKTEGNYLWTGKFYFANGEVDEQQFEVGVGNIVVSASLPNTPEAAKRSPVAKEATKDAAKRAEIEDKAQKEDKIGNLAEKETKIGKRETGYLLLGVFSLLVLAGFRLWRLKRKKLDN